jgi:hypothetical protein
VAKSKFSWGFRSSFGDVSLSLYQAAKLCDVTKENLKQAQQQQLAGHDTMHGHKITHADFQQIDQEKEKALSRLHDLLRD